ncbi:Hypothetical predicted protein [Marmota monax]|uniref:Uncharacterized protein n=1 Tax=Marmota monax TaxID=9995 RepID=A0A5E4CV16_MARMO|nr:Hypothetical predicted protein [Marmota monax]
MIKGPQSLPPILSAPGPVSPQHGQLHPASFLSASPLLARTTSSAKDAFKSPPQATGDWDTGVSHELEARLSPVLGHTPRSHGTSDWERLSLGPPPKSSIGPQDS